VHSFRAPGFHDALVDAGEERRCYRRDIRNVRPTEGRRGISRGGGHEHWHFVNFSFWRRRNIIRAVNGRERAADEQCWHFP
jgi:hypothetical protein